MYNSKYSYYRAGYSEGSLLYTDFLKSIGKMDSIKNIHSPWKDMKHGCRWLYNTAGLYDSTIDIHQDNEIGLEKVIDSPIFNQWLDSYKTALNNSTFSLVLLHAGIGSEEYMAKFSDEYSKCCIISRIQGNDSKHTNGIISKTNQVREIFKPILNSTDKWYGETIKICEQALNNKRVLIVSNIGKACYDSYNSNNKYNILDLGYIEYPSCFGNIGPDKNHMETISRVSEEINNVVDNYDIVMFATGATAPILADKVIGDVDKISIGSGLYQIFNIDPELQPFPPGIYNLPKKMHYDLRRYFGKKIFNL